MARRPRLPDPSALALPGLRAVAQPVDLFVRPGGGGVDPNLHDFAALSGTINSFLLKQAEKKADRARAAGAAWAAENPKLAQELESKAKSIKDPDDRAKALKAEFARLSEAGKIPYYSNPFFLVGYSETVARAEVGRYREQVLSRLGEATSVRGPDGSPIVPQEADQILAAEWEAIAGSPALQNFYGKVVATAEKQRVDEEFRARVAEGRGQNIQRDYVQTLGRDVGQRFDKIVGGRSVVEPEDLAPLSEYIVEEMGGHNVPNAREVVLEALELSFQRAAQVSYDEAVRYVEAAKHLVVGDVALGEDRSGVGLRLENLQREYERRAEEAVGRKVDATAAQRKATVQAAEEDFVQALQQASRDGVDLRLVQDGIETQWRSSGKFAKDNQLGFALESIDDYRRSLEKADSSSPGVVDSFSVALAEGRLDDAQTILYSSLTNGDLRGEDYATLKDQLAARSDVSRFVEQSAVYQGAKARYAQVAPSGFSPEVQQRIDDQVTGLQRAFTQDLAAYARTIMSEPNADALQREWISQREAKDTAEIQKIGKDQRLARGQLLTKLQNSYLRKQDAETLIQEGLDTGVLTLEDAIQQREVNTQAVDREEFYRLQEFQELLGALDARLQVMAEEQDPIDAADTAAEAYQLARDRYDTLLNEVFANPKIDPKSFKASARAGLRELDDEIMSQLFPGSRAQIERGLQAGEPVKEVAQAAEVLRTDLGAADNLSRALSTPEGREGFKSVQPYFRRNPHVSPSWYKSAAKWISGIDPFFGSRTTAQDVQDLAVEELRRVNTNTDLSPEERQDAGGSMMEILGATPDDVFAGLWTPKMSKKRRAELEVSLKQYEIGVRHGGSLHGPYYQALVDQTKAALVLTPAVSLEGYTFRPFTTPFFQSYKDLESFSASDRWGAFLTKLGLDPENESQVKDFTIAQMNAIQRLAE